MATNTLAIRDPVIFKKKNNGRISLAFSPHGSRIAEWQNAKWQKVCDAGPGKIFVFDMARRGGKSFMASKIRQIENCVVFDDKEIDVDAIKALRAKGKTVFIFASGEGVKYKEVADRRFKYKLRGWDY